MRRHSFGIPEEKFRSTHFFNLVITLNVNKPKWFEMFDIYLSKMPLLMKCCHMLETFEPIQITLLCASENYLNRDH